MPSVEFEGADVDSTVTPPAAAPIDEPLLSRPSTKSMASSKAPCSGGTRPPRRRPTDEAEAAPDRSSVEKSARAAAAAAADAAAASRESQLVVD